MRFYGVGAIPPARTAHFRRGNVVFQRPTRSFFNYRGFPQRKQNERVSGQNVTRVEERIRRGFALKMAHKTLVISGGKGGAKPQKYGTAWRGSRVFPGPAVFRKPPHSPSIGILPGGFPDFPRNVNPKNPSLIQEFQKCLARAPGFTVVDQHDPPPSN